MSQEGWTEAFWLSCDDPEQLRHCAGARVTDRKVRLFSCACCRRIWHMVGERPRGVIEVAERYSDGQASWEELDAACDEVFVPHTPAAAFAFAGASDQTAQVADYAAWEVAEWVANLQEAPGANRGDPAWEMACAAERKVQAQLFRDIIGNPFREQRISPEWLDLRNGSLRVLAQAAYAEQAFPSGTLDCARLRMLADLLEDVGCRDAELLEHLRDAGPHVRGCYVLDLLLQKQ